MTRAEAILLSRVGPWSPLYGSSRGWVATLLLRFPRVILAEGATHRTLSCGTEMLEVFPTSGEGLSKNSASSRAIPVSKMIDMVMDSPYIPSPAGMGYARGMGGVPVDDRTYAMYVDDWLDARDSCVERARCMVDRGASKQVVNRLLEPWMWVTQLITGTGEGWSNFLALRLDSGADPAIQELAQRVWQCLRNTSTSKSMPDYACLEKQTNSWLELAPWDWHVPYVGAVKWKDRVWHEPWTCIPEQMRESAARAAWLSYNNADGDGGTVAVGRTWERLVVSAPVHASPTEHQVRPLMGLEREAGNLRGWKQLRSLLPGESVSSLEGIGPVWK